MKLATYKDGSRDGQLVVVSRDLSTAHFATGIATTLQQVLDDWNFVSPPLEDLYAIDPDDAETVTRLRDIYNKRRSWRSLLDLERRQLDVLEAHPERMPSQDAWLKERRTRLTELAKLAQDRLGDSIEAIGIWNRLLEIDEADEGALTALASLYEKEKRFTALIEVLLRQKARSKDVKAQVALLERIGTLLAEKLLAAAPAVDVYREIVRLQPTHQKAMRTLRELYGQAGQYDELERLYGQQAQWDELYEVLLTLAERAEQSPTRIDLYLRAAASTRGNGAVADLSGDGEVAAPSVDV